MQCSIALGLAIGRHAPVIAQLRDIRPELRTRSGVHYTEVLENLYRQQRALLEPEARETQPSSEAPPPQHTEVAIVIPRRLRDAAQLKYVASLPCLVCGRSPSHAHHLRFIQLRSLGRKPSDEWTVPLCPIHHGTLHDVGSEEEWWQINGIDAKTEAERLWATTHRQPEPLAPIAETASRTSKPEGYEPNSQVPEAQATPRSESNNVEVQNLGRVLRDAPPASN